MKPRYYGTKRAIRDWVRELDGAHALAFTYLALGCGLIFWQALLVKEPDMPVLWAAGTLLAFSRWFTLSDAE